MYLRTPSASCSRRCKLVPKAAGQDTWVSRNKGSQIQCPVSSHVSASSGLENYPTPHAQDPVPCSLDPMPARFFKAGVGFLQLHRFRFRHFHVAIEWGGLGFSVMFVGIGNTGCVCLRAPFAFLHFTSRRYKPFSIFGLKTKARSPTTACIFTEPGSPLAICQRLL